MTRDQITETTYEAMIRMNRLKIDVGVTKSGYGEKVETGLIMAREIVRDIDKIIATTEDDAKRAQRFHELRDEIQSAMKTTGLAKRELKMPGLVGFRISGAVKFLLRRAGLMR